MRRRRPRAFSVVELLAVVAVLAALVSILAPSLARAKELARRAVCAGNLKHVTSGLASYATNCDNWLPPVHLSGAALLGQPWQTYKAYADSHRDGDGRMTPWNMAIAHESGDIADPRVFYCPSQRGQLHVVSAYSGPWGSVCDGPKLGYVRMGYNYSPYHQGGRHRYRRLDAMPSDKVLAVDMLAFDLRWNPTSGRHGTDPAWNLGFADGHVQLGVRQDAYDYIWQFQHPNDTAHDWQLFEILLEMLGG